MTDFEAQKLWKSRSGNGSHSEFMPYSIRENEQRVLTFLAWLLLRAPALAVNLRVYLQHKKEQGNVKFPPKSGSGSL